MENFLKRAVGENRLPTGRNHGEKHNGLGSKRRKMGQVFGPQLGHEIIQAEVGTESQGNLRS